MALKSAWIRWVLEELPQLRESGIIDPETEENLKGYYQAKLQGVPKPQNYFLLAFSIIGGALIACGVILIFNYNWDMLGKKMQILTAFLPLAMGAVLSLYTIVKNRSQAWRECSALLTSAGTAVLVALLSQIYHTGGTFADFMLLILLLALPLIYLFNSISLCAVYCLMLFSQVSWGEDHRITSLILLGGILPMILYHLWKQGSPFRYAVRYLLIVCMLFTMIIFGEIHFLSLFFTAAALLFYGGIRLYENRESLWGNPWLPAGFLLLTAMLGIASFPDSASSVLRLHQENALVLYLCLEGAMLAGICTMGWMDFRRKSFSPERILLLLMIPVSWIPLLPLQRSALSFYPILMSLILAVFGIFLLRDGWKKRSMLIFNGGFLMISVLIGCRFFDSNLGILPRAGAFLLVGIGFIASNFHLSRRLGKGANND